MGVKKYMTGQAVKGCDIRKYLIVRATQRAWQYDQVGKYGISSTPFFLCSAQPGWQSFTCTKIINS